MSNEQNFVDLLKAELRAAPRDAIGLVGSIGSAVGFLALVGYQPSFKALDWIIDKYRDLLVLNLSKIYSLVGIEVSIFSASILTWFILLFAMFLRGIANDYHRFSWTAYAKIINGLIWTLLVTAIPVLFIFELDTRGANAKDTSIVIVYALVSSLFYWLLFRNLRFKIDWSYPFVVSYKMISDIVIVFLGVLLLAAVLSIGLQINSGSSESYGDTANFFLFLLTYPIGFSFAVYAFMINVYIAIAIPRVAFGAAYLTASLLIADFLLTQIEIPV